jgi:hypothetical protein
MLRPRLALCLLALVLLPATSAQASAYSRVLQTYQQRGSIPPCQFTTSQLSAALKSVDTYGAQYFADFTNAIQDALSSRAGGACSGAVAGAGATGQTSAGALHVALPSGGVTAATGADFPAPIIMLAVLAALLALAALVVSLFRLRGAEPALVPWWRHLWGEAGYRAGGAWAEFVDWLRSG